MRSKRLPTVNYRRGGSQRRSLQGGGDWLSGDSVSLMARQAH